MSAAAHPQDKPPDLLDLRSPTRPAGTLPRLLRRSVPDPLASIEGWRRFLHLDLADLTPEDRAREALRLRVSLALLGDPADEPIWVTRRLELLEQTDPGGQRRVLK